MGKRQSACRTVVEESDLAWFDFAQHRRFGGVYPPQAGEPSARLALSSPNGPKGSPQVETMEMWTRRWISMPERFGQETDLAWFGCTHHESKQRRCGRGQRFRCQAFWLPNRLLSETEDGKAPCRGLSLSAFPLHKSGAILHKRRTIVNGDRHFGRGGMEV